MRQVSQRIEELKALSDDKTELVPAGIRSPQGRVAALADRWERMRMIIAERASEYSNSHRDGDDSEQIAGGKSGLLIKQVKQIGSGDKALVVTSYVLDRELLAELRAHEQQAAEELGQWATRKETYSQNLNVSLMNPVDLHKALADTFKNSGALDRRKLLEEAPELRELVGDLADSDVSEPTSTSDKSETPAE